tara:strand:- start:361 stop:1611 length:1251 start_codon:yes stop_codon:yes gene_type:complete
VRIVLTLVLVLLTINGASAISLGDLKKQLEKAGGEIKKELEKVGNETTNKTKESNKTKDISKKNSENSKTEEIKFKSDKISSENQIKLTYCKVKTEREFLKFTYSFVHGLKKGPFQKGEKITVDSYIFDNEQDLKSCNDYKLENNSNSIFKIQLISSNTSNASEFENFIIKKQISYLPLIGINLNKSYKLITPKKDNPQQIDVNEILLKKENLIAYCMPDPYIFSVSNTNSTSYKKLIYTVNYSYDINKGHLIMKCVGKERFIIIPVSNGIFSKDDINHYQYQTRAELIEKENQKTKLVEEKKKLADTQKLENQNKALLLNKDIMTCSVYGDSAYEIKNNQVTFDNMYLNNSIEVREWKLDPEKSDIKNRVFYIILINDVANKYEYAIFDFSKLTMKYIEFSGYSSEVKCEKKLTF